MKKLIFIILFYAQFLHAKSLNELYEEAKKNSPKLKREDLSKQIVESDLTVLRNQLFPKLALEGTFFYGDKTLTDQSGLDRVDHQQNINLSMRLFNGGREYTYFDLKKILPQLNLRQIKIVYLAHFYQMNQSFFELLKLKEQKNTLQKQKGTLTERVNELKRRARIGRSKKSDYLSSLAQLKRFDSDLQAINEKIKTELTTLSNLVGLGVEFSKLQFESNSIDSLPAKWDEMIQSRPVLEEVELQIQKQKTQIDVARANWLPTIDVSSNYYLNRREFGRKDDWDISVNASWNLWDFGTTSAQVQKEKVKLSQLQSDKQQMMLETKQLWVSLKEQFTSKLKQKKSLKTVLSLTRDVYNEQLKEFEKGLIDSLELTRSLDDLIVAENSYSQIKYSLASQWYAMKAFVGDFKL